MIIDTIFFVCLLIFLIRGYSKGVVVALFSVLAVILGITGALKLSGLLSAFLFDGGEKGGKWAPFLSYILVFILIVWLVKLAAALIQKSFELVALGWINRICGAVLYAFLVSVVCSSVLWMFNRMGMIGTETKSASFVYGFIEPLAPRVFSLIGTLLPFAKHIFDDLSGFFDTVNQKLPDVGTAR